MFPTETHSKYTRESHLFRGIVTEQVTGLMSRFIEFHPFYESIGKARASQIHTFRVPWGVAVELLGCQGTCEGDNKFIISGIPSEDSDPIGFPSSPAESFLGHEHTREDGAVQTVPRLPEYDQASLSQQLVTILRIH